MGKILPCRDAAGPPPRTRPLLPRASPTSARRSSFERRCPGGKGKAYTSDQYHTKRQVQPPQFTHGQQVCEAARRSGDEVEVQQIARDCHTRRRRHDVQSAKRWRNARRDDSRQYTHDKNHQTPHRRHTSVIAPDAVSPRTEHAMRRRVDRAPRRAGPAPDADEEANHRSAGDRPGHDASQHARRHVHGRGGDPQLAHARRGRGDGSDGTRERNRRASIRGSGSPHEERAHSRADAFIMQEFDRLLTGPRPRDRSARPGFRRNRPRPRTR
jgi:hypothetical protein